MKKPNPVDESLEDAVRRIVEGTSGEEPEATKPEPPQSPFRAAVDYLRNVNNNPIRNPLQAELTNLGISLQQSGNEIDRQRRELTSLKALAREFEAFIVARETAHDLAVEAHTAQLRSHADMACRLVESGRPK